MPRIFAKVNAGIWGDPDFRALPPAAQHLYLTLWTSPDLTFCGTHDWRPARLTGLSSGWTADHVRTIAACLEARHFLVIDNATEEALIRSWARFDETVKQPRLAVSYVNAYNSTASPALRSVLVHETKKMRDLWPELSCWHDQRVTEILSHPSVSAKDLPTPDDPFGDGVGSALALGLPQTQGKVWGSVSVPPTTTTTTTTSRPLNTDDAADAAGDEDAADRFEEFWQVYGKKVDRKRSRAKWRLALKKPGVTADLLIAAAESYVARQRAKGKHPEFTKDPMTWLNGENWNDEPDNVLQLRPTDGRIQLPPLPKGVFEQ